MYSAASITRGGLIGKYSVSGGKRQWGFGELNNPGLKFNLQQNGGTFYLRHYCTLYR